MRRDLPSGTVTFLFTDVEGSTKLLHELGPEGYAQALAEHRHVLREAFSRHGGVEVDTQGDAFFVAFPTAPGALAAAREMTEELASGRIRVRIGVHTGTPFVAEEGYVGPDVNRAARIAASGYGGQVLVSSATAALVGLGGLRDLGDHRLKDLSAAERIFQLGDGEFPRLKTLHQTNLPVPATPFLGRERELAEVVELAAAPGSRLVTLTGAGGSGKTRLALQAAAALAERYPDGVYWVPLAPLRDPALVLDSASRAVGAGNGLAEHAADKQLLLLFDNFEHVLAAADELSDVLARCPALELLVTSREPLRLAAEQTYPVPPLAHAEAVGFFAARARAVKPDFEVDAAVSEICRRLDDLPLALELAAARVKALSTRQLLDRLERRLQLLTGGARDAPDRQRTLRATVEWSYELLQPEERQLLGRLSVFRGGCTLEAAEAVCDADLDTLQSLVEKNLVRFSNERYWMLETIREFAEERLHESREADDLQRRHGVWLLGLAQDLDVRSPVSREWLDTLEAEHANLGAALENLHVLGEQDLELRLAEACWRYWAMRAHTAEGRRRLEAALSAAPEQTPARAHALNAVAAMAVNSNDYDAGRRYAEEALVIHRRHGDAWGIARATFMLGYAAIESGDFTAARPLFEETLRLMVELDAEETAMLARVNLAWAYEELGDAERCRELNEENLQRARATGNKRIESASLDFLAGYAREERRFEESLEMLQRSLQLSIELGDIEHEVISLGLIAATRAAAGDAELATRLLASSLALHEETALAVPLHQQRRNEKTLERIRAKLSDAAFDVAWVEGARLTIDEALALALDS